ncbi:TPA: hypothetical protein QDB15_000119 [Burkholderia vietnamiensis]|uniref:Uncharacterized protein n=1 Tax=Pandoraea apista TaxID=93218 RepID=A0A5E5P231_9BURK|nr:MULTISPECIES: hypothetical protein [Burkholderiaceae]MCA8206393.1 hypothetical protein [Burkholderia vietnamiensis]VVG70335.1 hypothetical protein PAP18089_01295 [Pandoraea apista]HDR8943191.1 hypothetical protein [Burkholderia vietnamiensis]HDR9116395.1 hypothetical protein [Burkholderia vietnamiensis]HDR9205441.1 hypothetical protein [Burkholderia vietnamiensis]
MADQQNGRPGLLGSVQERVANLWGRVREMRAVEAAGTAPAPAAPQPLESASDRDVFELTTMAASDASKAEFTRYMERFQASPTADWLRQRYTDGPEAFDRDLHAEATKAQAEALQESLLWNVVDSVTINDFLDRSVPDHLQDKLRHTIAHTFLEPVAREQGLEWRGPEAIAISHQFSVDAPESWPERHVSELYDITERMPQDLLTDLASDLTGDERALFDEHRDSVVRDAVAWVWETRPNNNPDASIRQQFEEHALGVLEERTGIDLTPQFEERLQAAEDRDLHYREVAPRQDELLNRLDQTPTGQAFNRYAYERNLPMDEHRLSALNVAFAASADVIAPGVEVPNGITRAELFEQRFQARLLDALAPFVDQLPAAEREAVRQQADEDLAVVFAPTDLPSRRMVADAVEKSLGVTAPTPSKAQTPAPQRGQTAQPIAARAPATPSFATSSTPAGAEVEQVQAPATPAAGTAPSGAPAQPAEAVAAPIVPERVPTGPWENYQGKWAGEVYDFWRARYADPVNNVAMSPREDAPDGFVKNAKRERLGLFDAAAFVKALPEGTARTDAFVALDNAYKAHEEAMYVSRMNSTGPDTVRLDLVKAAEHASFHAERSALLRGTPEAVAQNREKAREAFGALFAYDVKHGHPITDPDRDLSSGATVQEQFNWVKREDTREDGRVLQRKEIGASVLGTVPSEGHLFTTLMTGQGELIVGRRRSMIGFKPLQVTPLERSEFTAPQAIRTAIAKEHAEEVAAKNARVHELQEAQNAVRVEVEKVKAKEKAQEAAVQPFVPEPDYQETDEVVIARGKLVDHGIHDMKINGQEPTPYASIEDREGTVRRVYGFDIPRALQEGNVLPGMTVELRGDITTSMQPDRKTGEEYPTTVIHFSARPHNFEQHDAQQRAKYDSAVQQAKEKELATAQGILPFVPQPDHAKTVSEHYARGTLLEQGVRPHQDREGAPATPFAVVEARDGEKHTVWGKDLPKAIEVGGVKIGDTVELRAYRTEPKTVQLANGEQRLRSQSTWSAAPHDFVAHEAQQREAHEALHGKVREEVALTVEERMASWLDASVQNPEHYQPLARDGKAESTTTLASSAAEQTKVVAQEEMTAEAQRQASIQAAMNAPAAKLNPDVLNEGFNSIKVKGFASDGVAYSMSMGGETVDGVVPWNREANGLDGATSPSLNLLTAGARLNNAMGGPISPDDRAFVNEALHEHLEAKTQTFVCEHGHQVAPIEALLPRGDRLASRIDARAQAQAQTVEQDQQQGRGEQGQATLTPSTATVEPVQAARPDAEHQVVATPKVEAREEQQVVQQPTVQAQTTTPVEREQQVAAPIVEREAKLLPPGQSDAQVQQQDATSATKALDNLMAWTGGPAAQDREPARVVAEPSQQAKRPIVEREAKLLPPGQSGARVPQQEATGTSKVLDSLMSWTGGDREPVRVVGAPAAPTQQTERPIVEREAKLLPPGQSGAQVPQQEATGTTKALDSLMSWTGGATAQERRDAAPIVVDPNKPLAPQVQAHNERVRENSDEAKNLWEGLGLRGPKAEAAQRERLGLAPSTPAQGVNQTQTGHAQEHDKRRELSLNMDDEYERRR